MSNIRRPTLEEDLRAAFHAEDVKPAPPFTERDVDLCLTQAAVLRSSYATLGPDGAPQFDDPEYEDQYQEARDFDELARKIAARLAAGFELERQCDECTDGITPLGRGCASCVGSGVLPPPKGAIHG